MGMGGGFFAGGMAQGFADQTQQQNMQQYRQEELKLQQQGQQNAEKRFQITQTDKALTDAWGVLDDYVEHAKIAGHDTNNITKHAAGMLSQIEKLEVSAGRSQPGMASARFATLLAKPSKTDTTKAVTEAGMKPVPEKLNDPAGGQRIVFADPRTQTVKETDGGQGGGQNDLSNLQGPELLAGIAKRAGVSPTSLDVSARSLIDGNVSVLNNLGRGRQGGEAVKGVRDWAAHILVDEEGMSPAEAANKMNMSLAEFRAYGAGAVTLGRREAQVIGAAETAASTAPRVIEALESIDRTRYKDLNTVIRNWRNRTGDENEVRIGIAANTFVNNYARALGAGNAAVTDTARKEAWENLNTAWSKGQIKAAVDQMLNKELPSEITGAKMGLKTFLEKRAKETKKDQGRAPSGASQPRYKFDADSGELQ